MTDKRICALYSKGPHFLRMLHCLRENYPAATIIAAVPLDFPFDVIDGLVDETLRMPPAEETRGAIGAWKGVSRIRRSHCNQLVVMFDSPRLLLLSRLSGIRNRRCFTVDGRFYPLDQGFIAVIKTVIGRFIGGRWAYFQAWRGTRKGQ